MKLVRAGLGRNPAMLLRFNSERQILANLDHPNMTAMEAARIICEREPSPLNEICLLHLAAAPPDSRRTLRGGLVKIVLTAMRKEPSRRNDR